MITQKVLKLLVSNLFKSKSLRRACYSEIGTNYLAECLNDSEVSAKLQRHPTQIINAFQALDPVEIAHNYLNKILDFLKSPSTWIEFRKEKDYVETVCSLKDLWQPLFGSEVFDEHIIMGQEFENHFYECSKLPDKILNQKQFIELSSLSESFSRNLLMHNPEESYFFDKDSLDFIFAQNKTIDEAAVHSSFQASLLKDPSFVPNLIQSDEFTTEDFLHDSNFRSSVLQNQDYCLGLFEDGEFRAYAVTNEQWIALVGSEGSFVSLFSQNEDLMALIFNEDFTRQSLLRRHEYCLDLFDDQGLREYAASDASWVERLGTAEKFAVSVSSSQGLVSSLLDETGFADLATQSQRFLGNVARSQEWLTQVLEEAIRENIFENTAEHFGRLFSKDAFIAFLASVPACLDQLLQIESTLTFFSREERLLNALLSQDDAIDLLVSDNASGLFHRVAEHDAFETVVSESARIQNLFFDIPAIKERLLAKEVLKYKAEISCNPEILKVLHRRSDLVSLFTSIKPESFYSKIVKDEAFWFYVGDSNPGLRELTKCEVLVSRLAQHPRLKKEISASLPLTLEILRGVSKKAELLESGAFEQAIQSRKYSESLRRNKRLLSSIFDSDCLSMFVDPQDAPRIFWELLRGEHSRTLGKYASVADIADLFREFREELVRRSKEEGIGELSVEAETATGLMAFSAYSFLTKDNFDLLLKILAKKIEEQSEYSELVNQSLRKIRSLGRFIISSIGTYLSKRPDVFYQLYASENFQDLIVRREELVANLVETGPVFTHISKNQEFVEKVLSNPSLPALLRAGSLWSSELKRYLHSTIREEGISATLDSELASAAFWDLANGKYKSSIQGNARISEITDLLISSREELIRRSKREKLDVSKVEDKTATGLMAIFSYTLMTPDSFDLMLKILAEKIGEQKRHSKLIKDSLKNIRSLGRRINSGIGSYLTRRPDVFYQLYLAEGFQTTIVKRKDLVAQIVKTRPVYAYLSQDKETLANVLSDQSSLTILKSNKAIFAKLKTAVNAITQDIPLASFFGSEVLVQAFWELVNSSSQSTLIKSAKDADITELILGSMAELERRSKKEKLKTLGFETKSATGFLAWLSLRLTTPNSFDLQMKIIAERIEASDKHSDLVNRSIQNVRSHGRHVNSEIGSYLSKRPDVFFQLYSEERFDRKIVRNSELVKGLVASEYVYTFLSRNKETLSRLLVDPASLSTLRSDKQLNTKLKRALAVVLYNDPRTFKTLAHKRLIGRFMVGTPTRKSTKDLLSFGSRLVELDSLLTRLKPWLNPNLFEEKKLFEFRYSVAAATDNIWNHLSGYLAPGNLLQLKLGSMRVPNQDCVRILINEIFLEEEYNFVSRKKSPVVLDVGAHVGLATYYLKSKYPDSKVICFEPDPDNFKMLKQNARRLKFKGVKLVNAAVSNERGLLSFYRNRSDSMAGTLKKGSVEGANKRGTKVEVLDIDDLLVERVDFLKLDIEGSEHAVITSCSPKGLSNVRNLFCEFHYRSAESSTELSDIDSILTSAGFHTLHFPSFSQKNRIPPPLGTGFYTHSSSLRAQK